MTECEQLKECLDKCCEVFPIVHYTDNNFMIRCIYCRNFIKHENSIQAMILWNKMIRNV